MKKEIIINNEIEKNGNTNLISNSNLKSGSQIFAIGDSHSIFYFNSLKIKEHWLGMTNLPISMYRFINEGLDLYNIGSVIGQRHNEYNIAENDYVIFFYGFNDFQKNIYKYSNDNWKDNITKLISDYIEKINSLKITYNIIPIISFIYPNPLNEILLNCNGDSEIRRIYTVFGNKILKQECVKYNFKFFDIYDYITDVNGYMKKEYTIDNIHLDYNNFELQEYIENEIFKLINE
jgi:hypothetical protein